MVLVIEPLVGESPDRFSGAIEDAAAHRRVRGDIFLAVALGVGEAVEDQWSIAIHDHSLDVESENSVLRFGHCRAPICAVRHLQKIFLDDSGFIVLFNVPYTPGMGILRALILITAVLTSSVVGNIAAQEPAKGGKSVYVVTHVDVTPNFTADATKTLRDFGTESRKDPGAVRFEVLQQDSRPNHYTIVEVWQTRQAFEAHSAMEHTKRYREKLQPMLGSPFNERLHEILP